MPPAQLRGGGDKAKAKDDVDAAETSISIVSPQAEFGARLNPKP